MPPTRLHVRGVAHAPDPWGFRIARFPGGPEHAATMSRILILAPVLVVCVACSNQGARESYYQSRVTPTSSADAFGVAAQLDWERSVHTERRQVYELPASAPVVDGEAPPRFDCEKPGPKFKPIPMVAWADKPIRASGQSDLTPMVATSMARPSGDNVWLRSHPVVSGRGSLNKPGISQPPNLVVTGGGDRRPRSLTGVDSDVRPAQPMVGYNGNFNAYCEHEEGAGVLPTDPVPVAEKRSGVEPPRESEPAPR